MTRLAAVIVLAALAALAARVDPAAACSCALGDPRSALARADAAFVGRLVERRPLRERTGPVVSTGDPYVYVFAVDDVVKGDLGSSVEVISAASGASCGIEAPAGVAIGLFLDRTREGTWTSSLCSQIEPARLRAVAAPLPAPDGEGPLAFLVGGRFGDVRTIGLDARGRTLRYGSGLGAVAAFSVCPGSRRAVERVVDPDLLAVRDLRTFAVVRQRRLRVSGSEALALACTSPSGDRLLVFSADLNRPAGSARLVRLGPRTSEVIWRGSALTAAFGPGPTVVASGTRGRTLISVDVDTGRVRRLARVPAHTTRLAVSPDGRRVAGVAYGAPTGRNAPPSRVVVVDAAREPARVSTVSLGRPNVSGTVAWARSSRVVFLPGGGDGDEARVYDASLRVVGRFGRWSTTSATVLDGRAYGLAYDGRLLVAPLPSGPPRVLRALPGPEAWALAGLPSGPTPAATSGRGRADDREQRVLAGAGVAAAAIALGGFAVLRRRR